MSHDPTDSNYEGPPPGVLDSWRAQTKREDWDEGDDEV